MSEQNIAQQYYQSEYERAKKPHPWLYWIILGIVTVVSIITMMLA